MLRIYQIFFGILDVCCMYYVQYTMYILHTCLIALVDMKCSN